MRFHAFQSLLLTGAYIVVIVVLQIFTGIVVGVTGSGMLGMLLYLLVMAAIVAFLGAMIFGMVKGYQGQQFKFPVVGDMAEKWANG